MIDNLTGWIEGAIDSGIDWAISAVDGAADWVADLVPDDLLLNLSGGLGLGGGGLLAAILGYKLLSGTKSTPQRAAAEYATFRVPAAQGEGVRSALEGAGVTVVDGETVEGWTVFSVPRYHLGPCKRILGGLGVQWEQVA